MMTSREELGEVCVVLAPENYQRLKKLNIITTLLLILYFLVATGIFITNLAENVPEEQHVQDFCALGITCFVLFIITLLRVNGEIKLINFKNEKYPLPHRIRNGHSFLQICLSTFFCHSIAVCVAYLTGSSYSQGFKDMSTLLLYLIVLIIYLVVTAGHAIWRLIKTREVLNEMKELFGTNEEEGGNEEGDDDNNGSEQPARWGPSILYVESDEGHTTGPPRPSDIYNRMEEIQNIIRIQHGNNSSVSHIHAAIELAMQLIAEEERALTRAEMPPSYETVVCINENGSNTQIDIENEHPPPNYSDVVPLI